MIFARVGLTDMEHQRTGAFCERNKQPKKVGFTNQPCRLQSVCQDSGIGVSGSCRHRCLLNGAG